MPGGVGGEGPGSPVLPYPDSIGPGRKGGYGTPSGTPKTRVGLIGISDYSPIRDAITTDVAYARQRRRVSPLLTEGDVGGGYWL